MYQPEDEEEEEDEEEPPGYNSRGVLSQA